MKKLFFLLGSIFVLIPSVIAQTDLVVKDSLLYTYTKLYSLHSDSTLSLIDTGSSLCAIDSTYAVDKMGICLNETNKVRVNSRTNKLSTCLIDSVSFCGKIYRKVPCIVADLKGIFQKYAPDFVIGADILRDRTLVFNLSSKKLYPVRNKTIKKEAVKLTWKDCKRYPDVPLSFIIFEAKISGEDVFFAFDTGSRTNKLPINFHPSSPELIQRETANLSSKLKTKTLKCYKNITFQIEKKQYALDFFEGNYTYGLLNLEFLGGHSFILDYRKRNLVILPSEVL